MALIYDGWAVYSGKRELHQTAYGLSVWAAVTALITIVTGLLQAGVTRTDSAAVTGHSLYGIVGGIVITMVGFARYGAKARRQEGFQTTWLLMEIGAAALIVAAAITGHRLE